MTEKQWAEVTEAIGLIYIALERIRAALDADRDADRAGIGG